MKQRDILLIGLIVVISAVVSFVLSGVLFGTPQSHETQVESVDQISTDFPNPDSHYFNASSINPTKVITINQNDNADPFSGNKQ